MIQGQPLGAGDRPQVLRRLAFIAALADGSEAVGIVRIRFPSPHPKRRAMIDTSIPAWLCDALVRKGKILVVFDRVSEREIDTQRHVAQVHGSVAIGALLVTSRMPFAFEAGAPLTLHPQPLGSGRRRSNSREGWYRSE